MSKPVKDQITKELTKKFEPLEGVGVINPRGINATKNNLIRRRLHEKGMKMTVVKNTLARRAVVGKKLEGFDKLLDGPSAVIYGEHASISSIARLLLDEKKADDTLELRGIFFDGEIYVGADGVKKVSTLADPRRSDQQPARRHPRPRRQAGRGVQRPGQYPRRNSQDDRRKSPRGCRKRRPRPPLKPRPKRRPPRSGCAAEIRNPNTRNPNE